MDDNASTLSNNADTLLKYQSLLESGAITKEEFDDVKNKLLHSDNNSQSGSENTGENETVEQECVKPDNDNEAPPINVNFEWAGGKLLPHIFDDGKAVPYTDSFIKPKGQDTRSFCKEIAEMIERDLGRPVRYTAPKGKEKSLRGFSREWKIRLVLIAIIVIAGAGWFLFTHRVQYKGDVAGLVHYAQTLDPSDRPVVEVTGYLSELSKLRNTSDMTSVYICEGPAELYEVMAMFKDGYKPVISSDRVTVRGELSGRMTKSNEIHIFDAEVVD